MQKDFETTVYNILEENLQLTNTIIIEGVIGDDSNFNEMLSTIENVTAFFTKNKDMLDNDIFKLLQSIVDLTMDLEIIPQGMIPTDGDVTKILVEYFKYSNKDVNNHYENEYKGIRDLLFFTFNNCSDKSPEYIKEFFGSKNLQSINETLNNFVENNEINTSNQFINNFDDIYSNLITPNTDFTLLDYNIELTEYETEFKKQIAINVIQQNLKWEKFVENVFTKKKFIIK